MARKQAPTKVISTFSESNKIYTLYTQDTSMSFIRNEFANHITKAGRVISKKVYINSEEFLMTITQTIKSDKDSMHSMNSLRRRSISVESEYN